jgi:opacity protein-like surface antigen
MAAQPDFAKAINTADRSRRLGETMFRNLVSALFAGLLFCQAPASAQQRAEGWQFEMTPYIWFSGITGDVSLPQGASASFSADFGDIFDDLKFSAMTVFEARRDRLSLLVDLFYVNLQQGFNTPNGIAVSSGSVRTRTTEISAIGLYRITEEPSVSLELGGGVRSWWVNTQINANSGLLGGRSTSSTVNLVNGLIAGRLGVRLTDKLRLTLYGDVGGFNINSSLTWQAIGALDWQVTNSFVASVGWRHIQIDNRNSGTELDLAFSGPFLGLTYRF